MAFSLVKVVAGAQVVVFNLFLIDGANIEWASVGMQNQQAIIADMWVRSEVLLRQQGHMSPLRSQRGEQRMPIAHVRLGGVSDGEGDASMTLFDPPKPRLKFFDHKLRESFSHHVRYRFVDRDGRALPALSQNLTRRVKVNSSGASVETDVVVVDVDHVADGVGFRLPRGQRLLS